MGEAQKVKRPRTLMRLLASTACRRGRWPEGNKLRLSGMNRQGVLAEPLRQNFHDALGIALIAKSNYEIIRIADEEGTVPQTRLHVLLEPEVQHVMQEHIRKQGRDHSSLWRAGVRVANLPVLHHARLQPFSNQPQQHTVTYPKLKKRPQAAMIQIVEKLLDVHL
jgi:hypothetical protein